MQATAIVQERTDVMVLRNVAIAKETRTTMHQVTVINVKCVGEQANVNTVMVLENAPVVMGQVIKAETELKVIKEVTLC